MAAMKPAPPIASRIPTRLERHGHVRIDDYHWLRERDDPAVRAYLAAENDYLERSLAHAAGLRERLYDEIVGRIKKDDASVPCRLRGHYYYYRWEEGREYPVHCRRRGSLAAAEQRMLDVNELAAGHRFCSVAGLRVSSGENVLAFAVDTVGRRVYTLRFKDLAAGRLLDDEIRHVTGNHAWAEDDRTLFYTRQHPATLRSYQVWRHVLGTDPARDALIHQEADERFSLFVTGTKSRRFLLICASQTLSDEWRYLDAREPDGEFTLFLPREERHEHQLDHLGREFYVRTNWQARNFRLMRAPVAPARKEQWTELVPHRDDVLLEGFELFRDHLVVEEREAGLVRLRVRPWSGAGEHRIDFGEPAYVAWTDANPEPDTATLRYGYTSLTTPVSIYDYEMETRGRTLMKRDAVLGDFDPANYATERVHAAAPDGAAVPISLVYRKGFRRDGSRPLLLHGYGAYGASLDPAFRSERLSLLDRGFVVAIAHVRGGEELGRAWYEQGRRRSKRNTFTDFIACAEHLIAERYADRSRLFARGASAGGLLIGAVVNLRPELWAGAVAAVPFVDVVTTMLDPTLPLTTGEYDEWGDPNRRDDYEVILSYSPYDNVRAQSYPPLLVTTALHDSQVQYWEPAKWVAKLRALRTNDAPLLLHTKLDTGHGGASGRFEHQRETALEYAFLLDLAGAEPDGPHGR